MGIQKRMMKKMNKAGFGDLKFPEDMYSNIYGSLIICACMLSEKPYNLQEIKNKWRKTVKNKGKKITWGIDDKDFIKKTLDFFEVAQPENFPIAFVKSSYNCLFAPYVDGEILPLREDGFLPRTLMEGKIYPIDWSEENVKTDN